MYTYRLKLNRKNIYTAIGFLMPIGSIVAFYWNLFIYSKVPNGYY